MSRKLTHHFINVCRYCTKVYTSNRSTSLYCCKAHNSLYSKYGSLLDLALVRSSKFSKFSSTLLEIFRNDYLNIEEDWSRGYSSRCVKEDFGYDGPLPNTDAYLLVADFLICRKLHSGVCGGKIYFVKPFELLTTQEKLSKKIISVNNKFLRNN